MSIVLFTLIVWEESRTNSYLNITYLPNVSSTLLILNASSRCRTMYYVCTDSAMGCRERKGEEYEYETNKSRLGTPRVESTNIVSFTRERCMPRSLSRPHDPDILRSDTTMFLVTDTILTTIFPLLYEVIKTEY